MMKPNKKFDCVEMKRRGAEAVYEKIKDMTPEEELAYWQAGTEKLRQKQKILQNQVPPELKPQ
jgi:hypothetical protein